CRLRLVHPTAISMVREAGRVPGAHARAPGSLPSLVATPRLSPMRGLAVLDLPRSRGRRTALILLSIFFIGAGVSHFLRPDFYLAIVPRYLPAQRALVAVSGCFEILGGIGVLLPSVRSVAGWGLVALLCAVFPANLHMAMNPAQFVSMGFSSWALYARLPLQLVFIAWAYWATRPAEGSAEDKRARPAA